MRATPGIQSRLSLLGVLPASLIGLALAAYFTQARVADLDRNLAVRGDLIIRELAAASASPIAAGNRAALQDLAAAAALEDDILEVSILDRHGGALAVRTNSPQDDEGVLAGRWLRTAPVLAGPPPALASAPLPAAANPQTLGAVRLVLSRSGTFKRQRDTIVFSLAVLLGGLAASSLLARRIARKIGEPVMALALAIHELSKGNMDARAESNVAAVAELAYLQAGFNAMAAELQKNRDSLELQVRHATARLQEALEALEKRNQELESARWLAEAQTELKSRFLAQVSHDIRTPMNGIIGFAELLAKTPLSQDQAEKLGLIGRSAKNLLSIINDILDLSKLEAGKISLNLQAFALRPCLEDIACLLSARAAQPAIVLWIAPGVPKAVVGDPVRLQQVIANLLGNALKFTRRGKIVIRVRAWPKPGQGRLLFSVSDSGGGISPQDLAKLFSPFLQLRECAANAEKGSGLGLSIAKNIVASMGGKIRLASRPGKGTSLWFQLPLAAAEPEKPPSWQGPVALVEADRLFRRAVGDQLESLGARVEAFATMDALIERFQAAPRPRILLYGLWPRREKADAALPRWLEWCEARQIKPILLFPGGERRLVGFYRKRGAACLFHPLRDETLAQALAGLEPVPEPGQPAPARRGLRLLVADDNEINRLLLRAQLEPFGADVAESGNGKEALERMRRQRFDLVFLDLQMPLLDGPQVLRALRGSPGPNRHVPAVAITAFCAPGQRDAILLEGFADCLIKPILQEQLTGLVDAWLDARNGRACVEAGGAARAAADGYAAAITGKTGGNRELAGLIARKLFAELPQTLRNAETAVGNRDREAARHAVHTLNGSAGFAGLDGIRLAAAGMESALGQGKDWDAAGDLCQGLAREVESFLALEGAILDGIGRGRKAAR